MERDYKIFKFGLFIFSLIFLFMIIAVLGLVVKMIVG